MNQGCPGPMPPKMCTGEIASAKLPLPGQSHEVASVLAVNGIPVANRKIPFNCQPEAIAANTPPPLFSNCLPLPKGRS